jgi:Skp family chaperone for outer membrane proteins
VNHTNLTNRQASPTGQSSVLTLTARCLLLATILSVLTGCTQTGSSSGGVAIIDLDRVATALGWLDDLGKNLQAADTELRTQLQQALTASLKLIEDVKTEVAADAKLTADQIKILNSIQDPRELEKLPLTKEQREKLVGAVNRANTVWQNSQNAYQQQIQQRRTNLVLSYREKVRPAARRVAAARGLTVVLTTSDNVLLAEPGVDITNAVIDELQKSGQARPGEQAAAPVPAKPQQQTPAATETPAK